VNHIDTPGTVELDRDEAEDLAATLSFVEEWLRRANDEALADLADFIDSTTLPHAVRVVADVFIIQLGLHTLNLRERLKQVHR
jgi:hypothetical protein